MMVEPDNLRILEGEHPQDLKDGDRPGDLNVDVLREELEEVENGLIVLNWQTGTGKTYSVLENGAQHLEEEDDGTVLMVVPGQKLGVELERKLIDEHGLDEDDVNRIRGFERASDLYPMEEDEYGGREILPEEEWSETQRKVYEDRSMGQKPQNIVRKYRDENEDDEWEEQFEEYEGKFVIAPIEYLKNHKLREIIRESDWAVNDEDIDEEEEIEWDIDAEQVHNFAAELFDNHGRAVLEALGELREKHEDHEDPYHAPIDLGDLGGDEIRELVFGAEEKDGFVDWVRTLEWQMRNHSAAFTMSLEEVEERIDEENRSDEIVRTVGDFNLVIDNPIYDNLDKVKFILHLLNKARYDIYLDEDEPETYRELYDGVSNLSLIPKFGRIVQYERFMCRERPVEWGEKKRQAKNFDENKKVKNRREGHEVGYIEDGDEVKPYRLEDSKLVVFDRAVGRNEEGEVVEKPYFVYKKPVAFKLFGLMQRMPLVITDASFKSEYLDVVMPSFARYRARCIDVNRTWVNRAGELQGRSWETVVEEMMGEGDYWAFHHIEDKTPYYPIMEMSKQNGVNAEDVPEVDIPFRVTRTDVRGEGSTVTRLSNPLANDLNKGRFSKSAADEIKENLRQGDIAVMLRMAEKSDKEYTVISFKGVVEALIDEYDYFDEENTEYYGNLRGTNNLKGKNLIVIGTAMVNLNEFREKMIRFGFDREEVMNPRKEGERYVYDNPELQAMYEKHTEEVMHQAIERARGKSWNVEIYVLGIVPEKSKKDYDYQERDWNYFIEKKIVEMNGGFGLLLMKALGEGLKIKDLVIDKDIDKARYMSILKGIRDSHEDLALKTGESWYDKEVGIHEQKKDRKDYYERIVEIVEKNPEKVDEMTTSEFKDFIRERIEINQGYMDKEFFERLEDDGIAERSQGGFGKPKKISVLDTEQALEQTPNTKTGC